MTSRRNCLCRHYYSLNNHLIFSFVTKWHVRHLFNRGRFFFQMIHPSVWLVDKNKCNLTMFTCLACTCTWRCFMQSSHLFIFVWRGPNIQLLQGRVLWQFKWGTHCYTDCSRITSRLEMYTYKIVSKKYDRPCIYLKKYADYNWPNVQSNM